MKISIVTACYNAEKYIEETIESVIFQSGDFDLEYIIVDANSTDNTKKLIEGYVGKYKNNALDIRCNNLELKYISENGNGMYEGIVKGFELCTGDILAYINADDFYMPHAFSTIIDVFNLAPYIKWITGYPNCYNEKGQNNLAHQVYPYLNDFIKKGYYGTLFTHIQQESTFWRKELQETIDLNKFREYKFAGDYYLWYTFSHHTSLYRLNSVISGFRARNDNFSFLNIEKYNCEFDSIKDKNTWFDNLYAKYLHFYYSHCSFLILKKGIIQLPNLRLNSELKIKRYVLFDFKFKVFGKIFNIRI